jgi:hypothetical protein
VPSRVVRSAGSPLHIARRPVGVHGEATSASWGWPTLPTGCPLQTPVMGGGGSSIQEHPLRSALRRRRLRRWTPRRFRMLRTAENDRLVSSVNWRRDWRRRAARRWTVHLGLPFRVGRVLPMPANSDSGLNCGRGAGRAPKRKKAAPAGPASLVEVTGPRLGVRIGGRRGRSRPSPWRRISFSRSSSLIAGELGQVRRVKGSPAVPR